MLSTDPGVLLTSPEVGTGDSQTPGVSVDAAPPELELSDSVGDSALYAALGCACALLAILALLASACCARNRHKARRQDMIQ